MYWKLDPLAGTNILDSSLRGNTGVLMGNPRWTTPGAPIFDPVVRANGALWFRLPGEPGLRYAVEATEDLIHWSSLATNTCGPGGWIEYREDPVEREVGRFFRAAPR